jgi:hypothetical protein
MKSESEEAYKRRLEEFERLAKEIDEDEDDVNPEPKKTEEEEDEEDEDDEIDPSLPNLAITDDDDDDDDDDNEEIQKNGNLSFQEKMANKLTKNAEKAKKSKEIIRALEEKQYQDEIEYLENEVQDGGSPFPSAPLLPKDVSVVTPPRAQQGTLLTNQQATPFSPQTETVAKGMPSHPPPEPQHRRQNRIEWESEPKTNRNDDDDDDDDNDDDDNNNNNNNKPRSPFRYSERITSNAKPEDGAYRPSNELEKNHHSSRLFYFALWASIAFVFLCAAYLFRPAITKWLKHFGPNAKKFSQ